MKTWRLIIDGPLPGPENMAADELLLRGALEDGEGFTPALRLYRWAEPTISVGFLQDAGAFAGSGLPLVRRITGGRALVHHLELTYSVVAPAGTGPFTGGITGAYSAISGVLAASLRALGVPAEFTGRRHRAYQPGNHDCFHAPSRYEITARGRKLVGSAQRRFRGAFLQHGSIILDVDKGIHRRAFGAGAAGTMASVAEYVAPEMRKNAVEWAAEELTRGIPERFSEALGAGFKREDFSTKELRLRGVIAARRYSTDEWNLTRGGIDGGSGDEILKPLDFTEF